MCLGVTVCMPSQVWTDLVVPPQVVGQTQVTLVTVEIFLPGSDPAGTVSQRHSVSRSADCSQTGNGRFGCASRAHLQIPQG